MVQVSKLINNQEKVNKDLFNPNTCWRGRWVSEKQNTWKKWGINSWNTLLHNVIPDGHINEVTRVWANYCQRYKWISRGADICPTWRSLSGKAVAMSFPTMGWRDCGLTRACIPIFLVSPWRDLAKGQEWIWRALFRDSEKMGLAEVKRLWWEARRGLSVYEGLG